LSATDYPPTVIKLVCVRSMRDRWTDEETDNPVYADTRGFFKVEIWTDDTARISSACCTPATISIKAEIAPHARYYIRQGIRVVEKWPKS
jgi:hypothetical protein